MSLGDRFSLVIRSRFDARALALGRMAVGLAAALQGIRTWKSLTLLYTPGTARARVVPSLPDLSADYVLLYVILWMVSSICFAAGFLTSLSGVLLLGVMAYQLALDLNLYSNHVYLLLLCSALFTIARSGTAISVDLLLARGGRRSDVSYAPVFLIRCQLAVVYFFTALHKVNPMFLSGSMLRDVMISGYALPWSFYQVMAVTVIFTEFFLSIALWMKNLRSWAFFLGFSLHVLIPVMLPSFQHDLVIFSLTTLAMYFAFLPKVPAKLTVVWDDYCSFCAGWIGAFRSLDWLHRLHLAGSSDEAARARLRLTPADTDKEIKVFSGDRLLGGYDGIVEIAHVLPISFFWAPILRIWPIRQIGTRAYRAVAQHRKCTHTPGPANTISAGKVTS